MAPKIDWSLKKTIIKKDLDLSVHKGPQFNSWKRQVEGLFRESGADEEGISWEARYSLLESTCEEATFRKIDALRLQMPTAEQKDIKLLLDKIATVASETDNVWIHRHKFHEMKQNPDQDINVFYSNLVNEVNMCKFDEGFTDRDKQKVINLMLLIKLVFDSKNSNARSKLFEEKKLTLEKAINVLETHESLEKTEILFDGQSKLSVFRRNPPKGKKGSSGKSYQNQTHNQKSDTQQTCDKCGKRVHKGEEKCPAYGTECKKCEKKGHWATVCRSSEFKNSTHKSGGGKKAGACISKAGTKTEMVYVQLETEKGGTKSKISSSIAEVNGVLSD